MCGESRMHGVERGKTRSMRRHGKGLPIAIVYGIAITAMSFFTDPTISTLTSGTPSQNVDLAGLSFPRRVGVRFHPDFIRQNHYVGLQAKWSAFADKDFSKNLGKDFNHSDIVSREGWARYYFDGKFEKDVAYIRLQLYNSTTEVLVHEYYFEFRKGYLTSLDGRTYVKDPVLGTKIATDGTLTELLKDTKTGKFKAGTTKFKRRMLKANERFANESVSYKASVERIAAITQSYVKYMEKPKIVFLVTPPHLMKYAKLILILIKQLVDLNFDQSYMTKKNQKPLYKTRYMLDELGNLQSEGHGISGFETMLSIGLGQDQQFTLILQTLQQLKDVYGDSVDKIVQGNTSNIVFLKSTDDSMIETLQKMSGTTHKSFVDQKTVTYDAEKLVLPVEGKGSYMASTKEVPVISYNDMAFIAERNSIVFRAGDSPIWNKNETILPMSWRLHMNQIKVPGKEFSLQTIPTLSTAMNFNLQNNIPNFQECLLDRMDRALRVEDCEKSYKELFGYSDADLLKLDKDVYSDDIMSMVDDLIRAEREAQEARAEAAADEEEDFMFDTMSVDNMDGYDFQENDDVHAEVKDRSAKAAVMNAKVYAGGRISKSDLVDGSVARRGAFDAIFIDAYKECKGMMDHDPRFACINGSLCDAEDGTVYIKYVGPAEMERLIRDAEDTKERVYSEGDITKEDVRRFGSYEVQDDFYFFLADLPEWRCLARGEFDAYITKRMAEDE